MGVWLLLWHQIISITLTSVNSVTLTDMNIIIILFLAMIITGVPIGVLIDGIADKYGLPMQDGLNPVPWAFLGLVWPVTLLPFLIYCFNYGTIKRPNRKRQDTVSIPEAESRPAQMDEKADE